MKQERIRTRILTALGLALLGLLVVSIASMYTLRRQDMHRVAEANMSAFQGLFQAELREEAKLYTALLDHIEEQPDIQKAWLDRDREELFRQTSPIFERMHSLYQTTHFYFIDLDKVCFLRTHQKDRQGDTIERLTLAGAIREGKTFHGIELGALGTFTLRVVRPWRIDGKIVGYIEIGEEIDHLLQKTKGILDAEFVLFINKARLDRPEWEKGMEMLGRKAEWDRFPDHVVIDRTITGVSLVASQALERHETAENKKFHFEMSVGDREYMCGFVPLLDAGNREVGKTVVMLDITEATASLSRLVTIVTVVCVLVGAALFGFFVFYVGRIEKQLIKTDGSLRSEVQERMQGEEQLRKAHRELDAVIEAIPDPFLVIDLDYRIVQANNVVREQAGGIDVVEAGLTCHQVSHHAESPCEGETDPCPLQEVVATKRECRLTHEHMTANGKQRWVEITASPIFDEKGEVVRIVELCRDITERKLAEIDLRASEERFRNLFENAHDLIQCLNSDGAFLYVNPAWRKTLGYETDEIAHLNIHDIIHPDRQAEYTAIFERVMQGESISEIQTVYVNKSGAEIILKGSAGPLLEDGKPVGARGMFRDITERRRAKEEHEKLEAQLRQAQKMEAVGLLAGGVAHDFNNLLQAILGYGELALDNAGPNDPVRAHVEEVMKAGQRAATLVGQLLAFSRRQVLEMKDVDLRDAITDLMKMICRVIGEHITLDVISGHDLGIVRADRGQIEQILMNLCVNARDAMPDGGTITIETENVRVGDEFLETHPYANPGRYVLLSVTDNGCGMDEATAGKVFDPFFTTKELGKGTGLGLSTVYGLVKQHKGMVHLYSEIDKGTTFKIYLPMVERSSTVVGDKIEGPVLGGTETILLAEDNAIVRKLMTAILEQAGYTVWTANDGEEALALFEQRADEIDMAVLDVIMPKLGGRAVYERIREKRPEVRVLFASGYSMNAVHTNFVLDENLALIQKPCQRDDLLRRVREVLDGKS